MKGERGSFRCAAVKEIRLEALVGVFNQVIDSFVRQGVQTTGVGAILLARSIFHFLVSPRRRARPRE